MGPLTLDSLLGLLPYGVLGAASLVALFMGALRGAPQSKRNLSAILSAGAVIGALVSLLVLSGSSVFSGLLVYDRLGFGFALGIGALLVFALPGIAADGGLLRDHVGGVFSLLLLSGCGALIVVFSNHILTFFVGVELLSIPLYVLSSLATSRRIASEAAYKYFLLGAVGSAFFIYGAALTWGALGTAYFSEMGPAWADHGSAQPLLVAIGVGLMLASLAFKLGLVPFHMWVPDLYQGAPASLVAWMSGGVKGAILATAVRLFDSFSALENSPLPIVVGALAISSMVWGSFAALAQKNVKRMLAYSSVAHAGYMSIPLLSASEGSGAEAGGALIVYVLAYGMASLAAFVVLSVEEVDGRTSLADFSGLARKKPFVAFVLAVALFSLAGMPPLGGFIAKFNVLMLAIRGSHYLLAIVGVLTSLVSLAYYLNFIVQLYMREPEDVRGTKGEVGPAIALAASSIVTIVLGLLPGIMLAYFQNSALIFRP